MASDAAKERAEATYQVVCDTLTQFEMKFNEYKEDLVVSLTVSGEAATYPLIISVNEDRQDISMIAQLPFEVNNDVRPKTAAAVCVANNSLAFGGFDYDLTKGVVRYRLTQCFIDSLPTEKLIGTLVARVFTVADAYYDRLRAVAVGVLDLQTFMKQEQEKRS